jgi:hypothetical protein
VRLLIVSVGSWGKRGKIDYGKNLLFGRVSKDVLNGAKAVAFLGARHPSTIGSV